MMEAVKLIMGIEGRLTSSTWDAIAGGLRDTSRKPSPDAKSSPWALIRR